MFKFVFGVAALASAILCADAPSYLVRLKTLNPVGLQSYLEDEGYDVAGANRATGEVSVVTPFPFRIRVEQSELSNNPELSFVILSEERSEAFEDYAARTERTDAPGYFGVTESVDALKKLEQKYPQWVRVFNITQFAGAQKTEEGNDIYGIQVSVNPGKTEAEPKILIIGQHHARELTTQHAVLDSAEDYLSRASSGDRLAIDALQTKAVWFIPVLNPDGLNHVLKQDRMWRKNRAKNQDGTRGVDLNRNYNFKWGTCGMNSAEANSEVFKGYKANSEAEILAMDALNEKLHFQYSISYHSYGNEILNPYLCGTLQEQETYFRMRDLLMQTLGYGKRPPSSSGEDHEYHYNKFGTLAFLIEIGDEFQPPFSVYESAVRPNVKKVLPLLLEKGFENTKQITIVDADSGAPLKAFLQTELVAFKEGEIRRADGFGNYYWQLPGQTTVITASLDGYEKGSIQLGGEQAMATLKLKRTRFGLNGLDLIARFFPFFRS